ncbi:MAG: PaaI family thioesterase [Betaproteobacteria bacterium]|jgi:uncharacterized protein (TIGR00369 family)|nr:PaaI family thioesterase [Betaproteobacteria bacterium]
MAGIDFGADIPFIQLLGFELESWEAGESTIRYPATPQHTNSFGVAHGGACMTLLDVAMAVAARSLQKDMGVITIEMKTSFMKPSRIKIGALLGKGHVLQRTKTMAFVEARIVDAEGHVCAHSTGTFKYVTAAKDLPSHPISTD